MSERIKGCPMCGGEPTEGWFSESEYTIQCDSCVPVTATGEDEAEALQQWNNQRENGTGQTLVRRARRHSNL
jgi:hypothetical protein